MMILLGILCGAISSASLLWLLVGLVHRGGYEQGKESGYLVGYEAGRADADGWWLGVESEPREARQQIREEEAEG